jgi:phage FluMu protein Com
MIREEQCALGREARCECGQLIAKMQMDGIQLKCKRCKRFVVIPFTSIESWTVPSPSAEAHDKKMPAAKS